jgi:ribonuclease Z
MEIVFLGTSCMVPTKERNVQGIFISYNGEGILVDCGEGTQRQMNIAGINRKSVKKILISHWHGDHVSGIIGLIQTIGNIEGEQSLKIFGPVGSKERVSHMLQMCTFDNKIDLEIIELAPKGVEKFFETRDYYLECTSLDHSTPCLGFNFVEKDLRKIDMPKAVRIGLKEGPLIGKLQMGEAVSFKGKQINPDDVSHIVSGKKISFIMDTSVCESAYLLAKDADILISEAAYNSDLEEKAIKHKHMTVKQAAHVATIACAKKLVLTHISQRYKTSEELEEEARTYFPNAVCAYDFMKLKIK